MKIYLNQWKEFFNYIMYNQNCQFCGGVLTTADINGICVGCRNTLACAPKKQEIALADKIKELEKRIELLEMENLKIG